MVKYIDADAFVKKKREWYCSQCEKRKGMKHGRLQFVYEIGGVPCWACDVDDIISDIEDFPAADVEPKYKWVSVEDELPQSGYDILICAEGNVFPGYYNTDTGKWRDENGNLVSGVTHWMIIPDAPEE